MRLKRLLNVPPRVAVTVALSLLQLGFMHAGPLAGQELKLDTSPRKAQTVQPAARAMTLEPMTEREAGVQRLLVGEKAHSVMPENFREMGTAQARQIADTKTLTLRFAAAAKVTKIEGTPDFKVEQGGSCVEGSSYAANATCTVLVRFTPKGAGRRTGMIAVTNSADVTPLFVGVGGNGYSPTVSFTPSIISTVPQTVSGSTGILSGASNLAVDGGDALYMADTGNKLVRYLNPSGSLQNITFGFTITDPQGIGVDSFDSVYVTQNNPATLLLGLSYGVSTLYSSGSASCSFGSTCSLGSAPLNIPGAVAIDPNGNVFLSMYSEAYELINTSLIYSKNYIPLADGFNYNNDAYNSPGPLAVDSSDNIYAFENSNSTCFLSATPYYYASTDNYSHTATVAGGRGCGFSGDGGQARSALIGKLVKQMTFDLAGNLYFSDTLNNRVRRIDGLAGIITTVAGNGIAGYSGDGGPATNAALNTPTGVAVDSQGQVYIISSATSGQLVRKVGVVGVANFGNQIVGTSTAVKTVTVANTGNSSLNFLHAGFSSGNTSDFITDVNTTTCNFSVPLAQGRSCQIGFIFTATATGGRSAVFSLTDDTIAGVNTIQLSGAGYTTATLTPASFTFANTNVGSSSASQTATLTNTGKAVMTISSILFSGTGATSYTDTTNCGTTLAVGASCTISVTFKPAAVGALPATLTLTDNAITGKQTIALTGTGVGLAKASISPTSLTFASTAVGSTSAAQTIKLSNTGTAALGVTSITMTGTNAGEFPLTQGCGSSVAAGGSCTISVSFKPTATGTRTGTVSMVLSTGTLTAGVTGTAVAAAKAALTPTPVSFSSQPVASSSTAKSLTLANTGGVALTINSYTFSGTNAADFSQTHTCGSSLAGGANCTISVVFKPGAAGARSATLTVVTSAGSVSAPMSGTGAAAAASRVTLNSTANPVAMHRMLALTAHVAVDGTAMPMGRVRLMEGNSVIAEGSLSDGVVTFKTWKLSEGTHVLHGVYVGDAKSAGSTSRSMRQVVVRDLQQAPTLPRARSPEVGQ